MKYLITLFLFAPALASAAPFVCFRDKVAGNSDGGYGDGIIEFASSDEGASLVLAANSDGGYGYELAAYPRCETIQNVRTGLNATAIVFSTAGVYAACTGAGVPASIGLQIGGILVKTLELTIGQLPCDNSTKEAEIKALAQVVVCQELAKQGIGCLGNQK